MNTKAENNLERKIPRRNLLKTLGLGFLLGSAVGNKQLSAERKHRRDFTAMWTHACSLQVEYPDRLENISRKAFHTRIKGKPNTSNWIHFPIPTPVVGTWMTSPSGLKVEGKSLEYRRHKVTKIFVHFRSASVDAKVVSVHLHDGQKQIADFSGLNLFGENPFKGFSLPEDPEVYQGLCLSVAVEFGKDLRWIEFHSAGADFYLPA
ncbi:MAG: hypothetical protein KAS97_00015 [Candidatus Aminicenantes bacterium]|nr:hypothetical protein [Candidatus Aminicenantes bacterium]